MPSALRVRRIERVLDVDEGGRAAVLLRLGDDVQRQRRLTARFRSVDFDDAAAREPADAEREVEGDRSGRDDVERHPVRELAHLHDGALAELPLDLGEGVAEGGSFFVGHDSPFPIAMIEYESDSIAPECHLRGTLIAPDEPGSTRASLIHAVRLSRQSNLCSIDAILKVFTYLSHHYNIIGMDAFEALADPTRRRIVEMLAERELAAGEIARRFDMTRARPFRST